MDDWYKKAARGEVLGDWNKKAVLKLGTFTEVEDGEYFAVAEWSSKARAFVDVPGLYATSHEAHEKRATMMAGTTRSVRYTVHLSKVTTRKELR